MLSLMAIGNDNGVKEFFFNPKLPTRSSLGMSDGLQRRLVPMRSLDSLMAEGAIPQADFLKVDVEGYEADVLAGAKEMLAGGVLGIEVETSFMTSPAFPKSFFEATHNVMVEHGLRLSDLNFDRAVRPFYRAACKAQPSSTSTAAAGAPSTFNVLFCRDLVAQADGVATAVRTRPAPTRGAGPRFGI
jgi:Methyltransferase FkbM domain